MTPLKYMNKGADFIPALASQHWFICTIDLYIKGLIG